MKSDGISDQSRSNFYRNRVKTRGDQEELKIFLSNRLIPSRFNQELRNKEGIHRFLEGDFRTNTGPFDPVGREI